MRGGKIRRCRSATQGVNKQRELRGPTCRCGWQGGRERAGPGALSPASVTAASWLPGAYAACPCLPRPAGNKGADGWADAEPID